MKKYLVIPLLFLGAVYFSYRVYELISTEVSGFRYFSLFISGDSTNGLLYYLYDPPYFRVTGSGESKWKACEKIHENIFNYISSTSSWSEAGPYDVIAESQATGYAAYIKTKNTLLYVRGFPDYGGASPSEEEKSVCVR